MKRLDEIIGREYGNTTGIVVRQNGATVYERYFHGYTAARAVHVYSITKSVFSALVGIAIDRGHIASVNQRVADFFPDYAAGLRDITIRNLLTMTVPYKYETEPYEAYFSSEDWVQFALQAVDGESPAGTFYYSPIVGAHILSGVLAKATGRSIRDFATESLFAPLGIDVPRDIALPDREAHIAFGNGENAAGWAVDPQGLNTTSWGLCLTPSDMASIGQLYLDGGAWRGRQLVPAAWVAESTREHSRWVQMDLPYGYLWWILDGNGPTFAAMGDGGNVIYVNAEKRLVIAIACLFAPDARDRLALIREYIEPMLEGRG